MRSCELPRGEEADGVRLDAPAREDNPVLGGFVSEQVSPGCSDRDTKMLTDVRYWTAPRNTVEWNIFMKELVASGNALTRLMIEALAPKLKGATIGYFDSYAFFNDMYNHPVRALAPFIARDAHATRRRCT
jgi:hypothetical protein